MAKAKDAKALECKQISIKLNSVKDAAAETEKDLAIKRSVLKKDAPFLPDAVKTEMRSEITSLSKRLESMRQKSSLLSEKLRVCQADIAKIAQEKKALQSELAERQSLGECVRFVPRRKS